MALAKEGAIATALKSGERAWKCLPEWCEETLTEPTVSAIRIYKEEGFLEDFRRLMGITASLTKSDDILEDPVIKAWFETWRLPDTTGRRIISMLIKLTPEDQVKRGIFLARAKQMRTLLEARQREFVGALNQSPMEAWNILYSINADSVAAAIGVGQCKLLEQHLKGDLYQHK